MKTRPIAAGFFVVFCLLLCGFILRRQIAAHPLAPGRESFANQSYPGGQGYGGGQGYWPDFQNWRAAAPATAAQVRLVVRNEVTALHSGDGPKAMQSQSRFLRRRFSDPVEFIGMVLGRHPEIAHYRAVRYGPVWADPQGDNARAVITFEGQNGERLRDDFLLVREGGRFKVSHFRAQMPPN